MKRRTESQARSVLRERLQARRPEIEEAVLTRVGAIADPGQVLDPAYAEGLHASVTAALDFALEAIEADGRKPPPPVALLAQARLAARNGVALDTVLRRYFAGYSLLGYFLVEEAGREGLLGPGELQGLAAAQAGLFDRLLAAVGEEHQRESDRRLLSAEQRQAERVVRLLEGEMIDTTGILYDFAGWHLGVVASGPSAAMAVRSLANSRDCRLLTVERRSGEIWAWLGTRSSPDALKVESELAVVAPADAALALGEPGKGLAGWRLTHRQALAALPIARRQHCRAARYGKVPLLASALRDHTLAATLRQLYLDPLHAERDQGAVAKETLRVYFAGGGNTSSTAAALGVTRRTVRGRLTAIEERIGRPLVEVSAELETALALDRYDTVK